MISGKQITLLGWFFFVVLVYTASATACQWHWVKTDYGAVFNQFQFLDAHVGFAHNDECLWKTENGGGHWRKVYCLANAQGAWPDRDAIEQFQFFNAYEGWLLTEDSQLLYTHDGGISWTRQEFPGYLLRTFRFLDAKRGWWVGEKSLPGIPDFRGAIFATVDGGVHWTEQAIGIKSKSRWRLVDVWPVTNSEIWALGDEYLLHTLDGGKSWRNHVFPEFVRLRNNAIEFFGNSLGWIIRSPAENVLLSRDGGRNWQPMHLPLKVPSLDGLIYTSNKDAWVATVGGIHHSGDHGRSWNVSLADHKKSPEGDIKFYRFYGLQYLERTGLLIASAGSEGLIFCRLQH